MLRWFVGYIDSLRKAHSKRKNHMSIEKLIGHPHIWYIVLKVNPGLTSCEDLTMALSCDVLSVTVVFSTVGFLYGKLYILGGSDVFNFDFSYLLFWYTMQGVSLCVVCVWCACMWACVCVLKLQLYTLLFYCIVSLHPWHVITTVWMN